MLLNCTRVVLGLMIALFHVPLADFLREQDRAMADVFRQRGIAFPGALPERFSRNLFFAIGIAMALLSLARIHFSIA